MQKSSLLGIGLVAVGLLGGALWFGNTKSVPKNPPSGEPQKTAEEVLTERANQAATHLNTPLGQAVLHKDWPGVQKLYQPKTQFLDMAQIVRALFIENKMNEYTPSEQDRLLNLLLETIEQMDVKTEHLASLLITQIERLPSPQHDSAAYNILKKWLNEADHFSLRKRIAILKLALQDLKPDSSALFSFRSGLLQGSTYGISKTDWIQHLNDIRNEDEKRRTAEYLLKNYKKVPAEAQPSALVVLSHHLDVGSVEIKTLTLQNLRSEKTDAFEASLRAIGNLAEAKMIKSPEKEAIVKKLTSIPPALQSPFARAKALELLSILARE
ncbi:MAG: hypothetical protein H7333_04535 [Bdellovibrionales bacterium]|nr:hypothetical protein [Oligoflexia bacterium]